LSIFCSIIGAAVAGGQLLIPPAVFFHDDDAYHRIFSASPRIAIAGLLAVVTGDFCNSYTLAKMKIWNRGEYLWLRFVVSTIVGEGMNTIIFYAGALWGVLPGGLLLQSIVAGWVLKTVVEIVMLPLTYPVVRFLKRVEAIDYYDRGTNFNPFITGKER
jgi:uncharacterized integral membrane protein (TIGR00697 family)